jgi:hypothetical protein
MTQSAIRGWLDREGISYGDDEPQMIELLALSLNADVVSQFIKDTGIFEALDSVAAELGRPN